MKRHTCSAVIIGFLALVFSAAQTAPANSPATSASAQVPPVIQFSNVATDEAGTPLTGTVEITFSLYNNYQGGQALWAETQNVQLGNAGQYSVYLGITQANGIPTTLFSGGEAHWLGVKIASQAEQQPRIFLVSVPYALKAGDAQTIGGLPPSAFVLAAPASSGSGSTASAESSTPSTSPVVVGSGTPDFLPLWTNLNVLGNSVLFQSGSGSSAMVGINTTTPGATLDVNGGVIARGALQLPSTGTASASQGYNSQPFSLQGSAFNSGTGKAIGPLFQWQTEPSGNNTSNPAGTLNLLYGNGSGSPSETGLNIASNGQITFATGQTFPGTGTVTSVGSGAGLTGGPITGSGTLSIATGGVSNAMLVNPSLTVAAGTDLTGGGTVALGGTTTLNLDTTKVPQLNAANTFTGNQTVNGNLTATGVVTGSSYQIGSNLFAFGSYLNANAFLGFAGNTATLSTSAGNTGSGYEALASNTTGYSNTADGNQALYNNNMGSYNTADGYQALYNNTGDIYGDGSDNAAFGFWALASNTTGNGNTASGEQALYNNTIGSLNTASGEYALLANTKGSENTAVGSFALQTNTTGSYLTCIGYDCTAGDGLSNATAIGAHAMVGQSNSLVLGGTGKYAVKVGIGTTTPSNILTVGRGLGHPVSDSWETYSSRRWKTNIQTLPDALAKVEQLRGVSYDLKDSGKHEIGVIAEEVGKVIPEIVTYEDNGKDARGVDYSRLTALLIEATKEQQALIRKQQQQIRTQQAQLKAQLAKGKSQDAEIAELRSQVKAIQTSLKANGRTGSELRTVKAPVPIVQQ